MSEQPSTEQGTTNIANAENVEQTFEQPSGQGSTGPIEGTAQEDSGSGAESGDA